MIFDIQESLTRTDATGIFLHMRTTLNIEDGLLTEAAKLAGTNEKTTLVRMGLEALIEREAARRLAAMGGAMPKLSIPPRHRDDAARR